MIKFTTFLVSSISLAQAFITEDLEDNSVTAVPKGSTWANLAWGFSNGGKDSLTGRTYVDIDLFDQNDQIASLHSQGHKVICYFSAGSWESWRPDANNKAWDKLKIGKMGDWDELWLDVRDLTDLKTVMGSRIDLAHKYGCDGIEPDNIDCYDNRDCWSTMKNPTISSGKQVKPYNIQYSQWMASYTHSLGMVIGQKNALGIVPDLVASHDFGVNEECATYDECDSYIPYMNANKAVFAHEYRQSVSATQVCSATKKVGITSQHCTSNNGDLCSAAWVHC